MPMILAVISRVVSPEKRSMWMGTVTACATLGQFLIVQLSQQLIGGLGWATALLILSALIAIVIPLALGISKAVKATAAKEPMSTQRLGDSCGV